MRLSDFQAVIIGDLHGRVDLLLRALVAFGLADEEGRWTGGDRRLIQLGDLIDRGLAPLTTMDLLIYLQPQASQAGGQVTCLIGNHEAMALRAGAGCHAGRLQWALNGGWTAYREWLQRGMAAEGGWLADGAPGCRGGVVGPEGCRPDRSALTPELHPPHPEPFYALFGADGYYGRWLRSLELATRVGEYVVVHAGWNEQGPASVDEANAGYQAPTFDPVLAVTEADHLLANSSPLIWARYQPEAEIEASCRRLGCRGLITGHTIQEGIRLSAGGRLIQIDVGMHSRDHWAAVALDKAGRVWGVVEGEEPRLLLDDDASLRSVAEGSEIQGTGADGAEAQQAQWAQRAQRAVAEQAIASQVGAAEFLLPMPAGIQATTLPKVAPLAQFGPGTLVQLYRSANGDWRQYFYIQQVDDSAGYLAYVGQWVTANQGEWSHEERRRPTGWIDQLAAAVPCTELPEELRAELLAEAEPTHP